MNGKLRVLYVQYTSPSAYPPLEHSSQLLAEAGWEVLFLGTAKVGDPALSWAAHERIEVRELPPARTRWTRKLHYAWFCLWVVIWTLRWRPACVYASDLLSCPVVLALSYFRGLSVVYHEHDTPQRGARAFLWARRTLAERAAVRVLPNARRATAFIHTVANHRPTFTVWNCPSLVEVTPPRKPNRDGTLRVVYVGSIVPSRLPSSIVEALTLVSETVQLQVVGYTTQGHSEYVQELRALANRLGVDKRVQFIDAVPHADMLIRIRDSDVGLVPMSESEGDAWMPGASNKPFDYLASGLALLVADEPGWRQMYVDPGYARACNPTDASSIATAIRWFAEHPDETRAMGERGRQRVALDWNYETQFRPVHDWLDRRAVG